MPSTATVTGKVGPAIALTAQVFTQVTEFTVVTDTEMLMLKANGQYKEVDISAATTITCTVSGNTYTLTIA